MRRILSVGAVLALIGGGGHAQVMPPPAAGPLTAEQVVALRKAIMELQDGALDAMKAGIDAKKSVKPYAATAHGIVASSQLIPSLFPPGTDSSGKTNAKRDVWMDAAGFTKAANDLTQAAEKLEAAAEADDVPGFAKAWTVMARTCATCHRHYLQE